MKKGFLITGGNLFHHLHAEVVVKVVRYATGHRVVVATQEIAKVANYFLGRKEFATLRFVESKGGLEIHFVQLSPNQAEEIYNSIRIAPDRTRSHFIEVP